MFVGLAVRWLRRLYIDLLSAIGMICFLVFLSLMLNADKVQAQVRFDVLYMLSGGRTIRGGQVDIAVSVNVSFEIRSGECGEG